MVAPLNIAGDRYGRLVALHRVPSDTRRTTWLFRCDCGREVTKKLEAVRSGLTASCGCLLAETTALRSITHGNSRGRTATPELRAWNHAKGRCFNPNDAKFPQYGARGISMCAAWANDFARFLADMGPRPEGTTLDRIDVNGDYAPGNCRWATSAQQARNRTDNVYVEVEGERMILKDFARLAGVAYKSLHRRVRYHGETPIEAAHALGGAI